jgi:hypothetical protein
MSCSCCRHLYHHQEFWCYPPRPLRSEVHLMGAIGGGSLQVQAFRSQQHQMQPGVEGRGASTL